MFCGRYLEILLYEGSIQMCRVSMAETERLPEQAAQYFDVLFTQLHARLSAYLKTTFGLSARASAEAAQASRPGSLPTIPAPSPANFFFAHSRLKFDSRGESTVSFGFVRDRCYNRTTDPKMSCANK